MPLAGLAAGLCAQLGSPGLGGLEDRAHLLGGAGRDRRRGGAPRAGLQRLELVRHAPQVLVHGGLVVAAAADREVTALDRVSIHRR
jgi:hypothetical protein